MPNLKITVIDRTANTVLAKGTATDPGDADRFIKRVYTDYKDRGPLAARIEVDLDDECLER